MYPKHGASPMVEFPPPYRVKRLIFLVVSRGYCWHSTNMCLKSFRWNNRVLPFPAIVSLHTLGRVRSIVNYDIFYGIFLRGFANICAVSNSVIYDRALLWWSMGTLVEHTDASVVNIDRKGLCRFGFFSIPSPFSTSSCLSQHEKEIKNKLSTDSPCFGPLSVGTGDRKKSFENLWRSSILPKVIIRSSARRAVEGRWKGFSNVGIFVMRWS